MAYFSKILALAVIHTLFSRLVSIPTGMLMFGDWSVVVVLVFLMDLVQIPLLYYLYEQHKKIGFLARFLEKLYSKLEQLQKKTLFQKSLRFHEWGVILLTAMPTFGGGMWSGVLLTHLLKINRQKSYFLVSLGSILGCVFLALGWGGIKNLFYPVWRYLEKLV
ncbi:MAG: small multi-drug export protein [Elusimicrobiota bacterium]